MTQKLKPKDIKARDVAFENDNIYWVRRQLPPLTAHQIVQMTFHKARYECSAVSDKKRRESQRWLAERRWTRMNGDPVNIGDPLPE